ncbi:MAG: hypothetical protein HRU23_17260 [Gammaproteobacteria bacterium]|nr:hypothetical protein [Gammaproteobacteria bacterium]
MSKKHIGFLSPQPYMASGIKEMEQDFNVHALDVKSLHPDDIQAVVNQCKALGISAVAGYAQKDAFPHILINEQLGNDVPSRLAFFYCMNKYLMRTLESNAFFFAPVDPLTETDDEILAKIPDDEWPFMLKNTSLSLGRGIFKIASPDELRATLKAYREDAALQELIAGQYKSYLSGVDPTTIPAVAPPFIAEHMVDMNSAIEYCLEGYITGDGKIVNYALTEEVYFSNHQALGYVTPPISINANMATKIEQWVEDYMGRLAHLGYRNQFFNLEFWIMPDGTINLTEINPRAAHTFHYNYLYSCNNSLYGDNLLLAGGEEPSANNPWQKWRSGKQLRYTLIVLITGKETGTVSNILDYDYIAHLEHQEGILIRHNRQKDDVLTDDDMTVAGVMLLQMWIVGDNKEDVISKEHEIRANIYRKTQSDIDYPPYWSLNVLV